MQELLNREEEYKLRIEKNKSSIKCTNCNKYILFIHKTKSICPSCGKYVFKNKNEEFEYRLKERLNKVGK